MKKLVSIFLLLALIIFQVDTIKVFADTNSKDYCYYICDHIAIITKYIGSGENVVIPDNIDGYAVTIIDSQAFYGHSNLTSITIPNSVTKIGFEVFAGCSRLTSINIPSSVTDIDYSAFSNCTKLSQINVNSDNTTFSSLDGVLYSKYYTSLVKYPNGKTDSKFIIPNSVTSISSDAFDDCSSLTSITIPNSVTSIGSRAFYDCSNLTNITIPSSVTSINTIAFLNCTKLSQINVNANNTTFSSLDGVLYNKDKTTLIIYPTGKTDPNFIIPNGVTSISYDAFCGYSNLISITIPSSFTCIGSGAFLGCTGLTSITIPSSVTSIGSEAFNACSNLTSINIPSSVTNISEWAFYDCSSLTSITIPNSVTSIGDDEFCGCSSLTNISIPNSVTSIGYYAFYGCSNLTSITIPTFTTCINSEAFYGCSSLTSISIPASVTSIGYDAFYGCTKLSQINVNDNNSNFSSLNAVLYNKDKTTLINYPAGKTDPSFIIPNSVATINYDAFYGCYNLTSITIPSSVTKINSSAFYGCTKLNQINVNDNNTNYSSLDGVLYNKLKTTLINYPAGKADSNFIIPNPTTNIDSKAFYGCSNLTNIDVPNSVTGIGYDAFYGCTKLSQINVNDNNTNYSSLDGVLYDKHKTTIIKYPSGKTDSNFIIPNSITSINDSAFYSCSRLTSITIPNYITSISADDFYGCSSSLTIYYHSLNAYLTNPWYGYKTVSCNIVSYNGNGTTSGTVPVDNNLYAPGSKASLLNNTGNLVKTGYVFAGWNTAADGSGTSYPAGSSISMNGTDITLYAQWKTQIISPTTGTFTKAAPNDLKTTITAPNKIANPITGVYNGSAKLIGGTDEAIIPTTTGYTLTLFKSYLSKLTSNTIITVKFKDGSSLNYNVIISTATISPVTATFIKAAPADLKADITAPNKLANPVTGVYNGTTRLIGGTDEAVTPTTTGYTLTLFKSYLSKLTSNTVITVKFKDGSCLNYNVVLGSSISPTTGTFTKAAPTDLKAAVTAPDKATNPVTGVYNGSAKLIACTDEAVTSTTSGYTLTLFKSYLSKLTSNSVITVRFKDGSSLNYTVNVK